jgi:hypothetical protein
MSKQNPDNVTATTQVAAVDTTDYKDVVQRLVKAEHTIETKDKELAEATEKVENLTQSQENLVTAFSKGVESIAQILGDDSGLDNATAENFFDKLAQALTERLSKEDELSEKLAEAKAELEKLEAAKVLADRKQKIRETLGLAALADDTDEVKTSKATRVDNLVKSTERFDAESFDAWLNETAELLALSKKMPWMDEEKDKDKKKKEDKSKAEDEGVTDTEVLDNVQATASMPAGSDDIAGEPSGPDRWKALAADLVGAMKNKEE